MAHPTEDRNFRLPTDVRPSRYQAHLVVDLAQKQFQGSQTLRLSLPRATNEVILHAAELTIGKVAFRAAGRTLQGRARTVEMSETAVLTFDEPLPSGEGELELEWTGKFNPGLRGLYLGGKIAVTQFEAADARRVFPSFDEPLFKARWAISVDVPANVVALSNGKPVEEKVHGDRKVVRFEETELLSSYLVALAVGEMAASDAEQVSGIPVRTWAVPEKVNLTRFGQDVAMAVLPRLSDYFGLPYAFGKVDQIGIPDFEAGAMENAGLITYREVALLVDPKTASLPVQKRIAEVVTHELSHQWFGNWVTMVWWDDLWLNEAFATWMAYKIVDEWKPEWRLWLDYDQGKAAALALDALESSHPIVAEVHNAAEATENFDAITYEKGGGVLRMIEAYLGAEKFREGIRAYMKRHARSNAVADDLWRALGEASNQPVMDLAHAWLGQRGFPLVTVTRDGNKVTLTQRQFFSEPGKKSDALWPVPVLLRYRDEGGIHEHRLLLRERSATVDLKAQGQVKWVCGNARNTGFYRVAYDQAGREALAQDLPSLDPAERIALLADAWALLRCGEANVGDVLDLLSRFGGEEDYAVLDEVVGRLGAIDYRLVADKDQDRFRAFARRLLEGQFARVGLDARADEPGDQRQRRAALVRAVAVVGRDPRHGAELRTRLQRVLAGDKTALEANLHDSAAVASARAGDATLFDALLAAFKAENDPAYKRRYLQALTQFESAPLAQRAVDLAFTEVVPLQDLAGFVSGLLSNRSARTVFWSVLKGRWAEVEKKVSGAPMIFRRIIEAMGNLRERAELEDVRAHLAAHPNDAVKAGVAQTLERLSQDVSLRERTLEGVSAWLARQR